MSGLQQPKDSDVDNTTMLNVSQHASSSNNSSNAVPLEAPERHEGAGKAGQPSVIVSMEVQEALLPRPEFKHPLPRWRRIYMVCIFSLMAALLYSDQNLLAPNLTAAANDFGFDSDQKDRYLGGYLMAAFFLVGAPAALLVGWLADKVNRVRLLFVVILIGCTPCLLTYWVTAFWQFFLLRILTGVSVGGCFPLVFSLLGDLFPVERRAAMAALIQIATGFGIGVGQGVAGFLGPSTNWRLPFVVMSVPAIALNFVMLFTAKEPPRGGFEEALRGNYAEGVGYSETITWPKVKQLLRVPSNWLIILQGLPGCLPWGVMLTYMNDYLSQEKGFTVESATVVLLLFGIVGGVGIAAGGAGGQWLYNRRKEWMTVFIGGSVLLGIAPTLALINVDLQRIGLAATIVLASVSGFVISIPGPNMRATMLNVNDPETRGVALALQSLTDDLGKGLGPVLVAEMIGSLGRQTAFNISILGWIPCGLLLAGLTFCIRKDEAAVQARLTVRADKALEAAGITSRGLSPTPDPEDGTGATASGTIDAQTGSSSARASEGGSSNSNRVEVLVHGAEGQQSQAPAAAAAAAVASVLHKALSRAASIASSSAGSGPASPLGQRRKNNHSGDGSGADGSEDGRLLQSGTPKSDEGSGRMAPVQQQQQEMLQLSSAPTGAHSSLGPGNLQPTQLLR